MAMETVPADELGLTAWTSVELTIVTEVAAIPPKVTVVPPVTGPEFGETLLTEGPEV